MADETPPHVDSRTWTGDLSSPPPLRSYGQMQASPAALPAVFAFMAAVVLLPRAAILVWELSGASLPISPGPNVATSISGLAVGLIVAALARRQAAMDRAAIAICACEATAFGLHGYHYLSDWRSHPETCATSLFVEAVRMPGASRGVPLVPTVTVSTSRGRRQSMIAGAGFAERLIPGDTCLKAEVRRGRHGFAFVRARITSAGDGTGSFVVADANRARRLRS